MNLVVKNKMIDKSKVQCQEHPVGERMVFLKMVGFPGGSVVKNTPANAGDTGSSPGPGRSHMPRSN